MSVHELVIQKTEFDDIISGVVQYAVVKPEEDIKVNDIIDLKILKPKKSFKVQVSHINRLSKKYSIVSFNY